MINLSLVMRKNPRDPDAPEKCYAVAQTTESLNLEQFSKHIATHGSVYKRSDIMAVLTAACDCLREMLLEGKRVRLGVLGDFFVTVNTAGADKKSDFDPAVHVKDVNVNWSPGSDFETLKKDCTFQIVAGRRIAAKVLSAIREDADNVQLKEQEEDGDLVG